VSVQPRSSPDPASGGDIAVGHASIGAEGRLAVPRGLVRVIRRDPEHLAERLTLYAVGALGQETHEWAERKRAERPGTSTLDEAHTVRVKSARVARIDGAIAGCPLYIALVPAYVAVLYQQVRMVGRIAALEGNDPRDPRMAAEMLALRGLYPTPDAAAEALAKLAPELPSGSDRPSLLRSWRTWYELVKRVLVLVGMLAPPEEKEGPRPSFLRRAGNAVLGGLVWISTWVIPGAFMVVMSWACESSTRQLGARAQQFYSEPTGADRERERPGRWKVRPDEGSTVRKLVRIALLALAVAIPLVFLFLAAVEQHQGHRLIWLSVVGGLTALALVAGLTASARK